MLTKWDEPTLDAMIENQASLGLMASPNRTENLRAFRRAEQRVRSVAGQLQRMLRAVGYEASWELPTKVIGAEIGSYERQEAQEELRRWHQEFVETLTASFRRDLEQAAETNLVGRIEWLGDHACRFDFFEKERSRGLTTNRTRTVQHTHELIDARKARLPAYRVKQPARCKVLIRAMPVWMQKHAYIVTGTQIAANLDQVDEREEPNELVETARWLTRSVRSGAQAVRDSGRQIGRRVNRLASSIEILKDPALVIGDYVLTGWEE